MTEVLADIPVELDAESLMQRVHVERDCDDAREFEALVRRARETAKPKAVYRECFVEGRGDGTVTLTGVTFTSRTLRRNLDKAERVFAFVCTCGRELDRVEPAAGDFLRSSGGTRSRPPVWGSPACT